MRATLGKSFYIILYFLAQIHVAYELWNQYFRNYDSFIKEFTFHFNFPARCIQHIDIFLDALSLFGIYHKKKSRVLIENNMSPLHFLILFFKKYVSLFLKTFFLFKTPILVTMCMKLNFQFKLK